MTTGDKKERDIIIDIFKRLHPDTLAPYLDWEDFAIGDSGDKNIEKAWLKAAKQAYEKMPEAIWELYRVFCKKQHDYGPQNIALGGTKGVTQRMVDKMSRLWNLQGLGNSKETAPANLDEVLYDTLMDLADYAIIAMLTENGSWPQLSIEDAFSTPKERDTQPELPLSMIEERRGLD